MLKAVYDILVGKCRRKRMYSETHDIKKDQKGTGFIMWSGLTRFVMGSSGDIAWTQ
jgi:hypothetical protein